MQTPHPAVAFRTGLTMMLRARFPIVYVETFEEQRALTAIESVVFDPQALRTPRPLFRWSTTRGLIRPDGSVEPNTTDPRGALDALRALPGPKVAVFFDLHAFLGDSRRPGDPALVRTLRELVQEFASGADAQSLIIVAPQLVVPQELEKAFAILDFPLPTEREIRQILEDMIAANAGGRIRVDLDEAGREKMTKAALGLTVHEASNAFARAMVDDGVLDESDIADVMDEKRQTVRKTGLLEFVTVDQALDDIGGLQNLKNWLAKRNGSWLAEAAEYGIPAPRGILMTGVPGCGKSLTAKAISAAWGLPLLRMDIGRVFSGLVGSSEQNMRSAIRAAEATAPCVLWIDEIEKGFASSGAGGDSGTSSRVFGSFLTWMQEKSDAVFVVATANKAELLPAELLRKGRFDEIFFIDLPTEHEREAIWRVHLERRLARSKAAGIPIDDALTGELARISEGYTGAEIEQAVLAGLFDAFSERRTLTAPDLVRAVTTMIPLSVTQAEQIAAIRTWAADRAVAATSPDDRSGYVAPAASASAAPQQPPATTTAARGGRMVEF